MLKHKYFEFFALFIQLIIHYLFIFRVSKIRIEKARLHELSGLKKSVFDKLVLNMTTLHQASSSSNQQQEKKSKAAKRPVGFIETVEAKAKGKHLFW